MVPAQLLSPKQEPALFVKAGAAGDVVSQRINAAGIPDELRPYLRTARGAVVRMPTQFTYVGLTVDDIAVDGNSTVAYTSPADGLPHLFRCH